MADLGYCHCPECKKWIPSNHMNYFDGIRVCDWCLNQEQEKPPHNRFVHDPNYGKVQCIWCDSYNTERVKGTKRIKCNNCEEEFIL